MPGQLKEVRDRIASVKSTQQITKAMKLVAASKLRKAQDRIVQMRPYSAKLYDMLRNIMAGGEGNLSAGYGAARPIQNVLIVVISSDRGLCGGFNANMVKLFKSTVEQKYKQAHQSGNITVLSVGKKAYEALKKDKSLHFITNHIDLFSRLSFEEAMQASEQIMKEFVDKKYDAVEVIYNQFKNQITQLPTVEQFLPIEKLDTASTPEKENAARPDFIFLPNQENIIAELVPKILKTRFYRFLLDSNASEHGARMTSMDNATNNAEDLLVALNISYNRARQAAITTELSEIVSGAAALQG
ncbi:MAG: ATP synthase F1 subunit gamma [Sphingobacteriales bacterium]|jgi:F-type H+-transporting ATPase subunit gamma|nr:ATP synthase F1 subunit gamma [Sphingobacteriales bacterium]